jgi:hypothetical protein
MSVEKPSGNNPASQENGNANKSPGKNNRRRSLRSKRRGRKPGEGSEAREPRETREQPPAPKPVEKSVRDNRDRRRRRRMRAKTRGANETPSPVVEDILKDLPPLVPAFVYTHVLRPSMRDNFEFRTEHFSKVTRKLEDFHIDLSPLYPDGGDEIKGVGYMPPVTDRPDTDDSDEESFDDEPYDAEWETDESPDAARLDGVTDETLDELKGVLEDPAWEEDSDDADYL